MPHKFLRVVIFMSQKNYTDIVIRVCKSRLCRNQILVLLLKDRLSYSGAVVYVGVRYGAVYHFPNSSGSTPFLMKFITLS